MGRHRVPAPQWLVAFSVQVLMAAVPAGTLRPAPGSPFNGGLNPCAIATGDFNGDGKLDLAVANRNASAGGVTLLLGDGLGGFTLGNAILTGGSPWALAAGDFNGDGRLDLVVANYGNNNVMVLIGDGRGGFTAAGVPIATGNTRPAAVAVGDFNKDGKLDFAVANFYGGVGVYLQNNTGGFTPAVGSPFPAGNGLISLAVADFNGDGRLDIAVANYYGDLLEDGSGYDFGSTVSVLLGNTIGSFTKALGSPFRTGFTPDFVTAGDLNGDGFIDLAVANQTSSSVSVLLGKGIGTFSSLTGVPLPGGLHPSSVVAVDLDGDGVLDLAVTSQDSNSLGVYLGNRSGGLTAPAIVFATGVQPFAAVAADFNGDGRMDLAIANLTGGVTVLLGSLTPTTTTLTSTAPGSLRAQVSAVGTAFSTPGGTVSFLDGNVVLGTVNLANGVATFDSNDLRTGFHLLSANYNGDGRAAASASSQLTVGSPTIQISGLTNGASFLPGIAAPNTILSLFGSNLSCGAQPQVLLNGVAAEILATTSGQINLVAPAAGTSVQVVCGGDRSPLFPIASAASAPGIFTASAMGTGQGSILNGDGSVNSPAAAAARGDYVSVFATGFGQLGEADGNGLRRVSGTVQAFVGEAPAEVQFAGAAPGYTTGLQQINVRIPAGAVTGPAIPIRLAVDAVSTQSGVTLAVR